MTIRTPTKILVTGIAGICAWAALTTHAADIKILSSNGISSAMLELAPAFERATGHRVSVSYDTGNLLTKNINEGADADLLIIVTEQMAKLSAQGKIRADTVVRLFSNKMGLAVRAGAPKPDISTPDALKRALLAAKSVTYTATGASGLHFVNVTERLGIAAEIRAKSNTPPGGLVAELVAKGQVEMAVQQNSELLAVPGVDYVGPLPESLQNVTQISSGVFSHAQEPAAAQAFINFLVSPEGTRVFRAKGMTPER